MIRKLWIQLRSSLWFVPALLVLAAISVAVALIQVDLAYANVIASQRWQPLLNAGAEGARGMLTAIASSMITVAGVAFSVTIVSLSLASTQYTPRILRNFMRDRANQFVLGTFVAIFTYCLVVLRTIRGGAEKDGGGFVPLIAVAFGMLLALVSIGCLIFFIHHVAASIQASNILKRISDETTTAIENLFPCELADDEGNAGESPNIAAGSKWTPIRAKNSGYLQHVNADGLFELAGDASLRLERMPGDFVAAGAPLVSFDRALDGPTEASARDLFVVGDFRTVDQDAGFGIRQIVDIALKALSPGVNDTSTAVSCIDYLSVLLSKLAHRRLVPQFMIKDDKLRVLGDVPSFANFAAKSFDEIRLSAPANVTIILQMLCALDRVAIVTRSAARKQVLLEQARVILDEADRSVTGRYDRARINLDLDALRSALNASVSELPALRSFHAELTK